MRVYLDNCVFNRPFDDQDQSRVKRETEAVNKIRKWVEQGLLELAWSYVIDLEVFRNPFADRRQGAASWKIMSATEIGPSVKIVSNALELRYLGLREIDSLHIACAIESKSDYFVTTDDVILKRATVVSSLSIVDPVVLCTLVKELL
jgi:hypothetical protein